MADAGQSDFSTIHPDAVLDFKMAGLHADARTKTMDREHAVFADRGFAERTELLYGLRSCGQRTSFPAAAVRTAVPLTRYGGPL